MKFTKEQAIEKIKALFSSKVEKIDKWERTIKETVDNLFDFLGEESEIELDDFAGKAVKQLNTQKGHIDKEASDVASDLKNQIEELKKQIPQKKKKKGEDDDDEPNELETRLKAIEDELKAEKAKNAVGQKKTDLIAALKEKGVKNEKWMNKMLGIISIDSETDINKKADELVGMYNDFIADETPDSITPRGSGSGNRVDKIKDIIKAAGESLKADES